MFGLILGTSLLLSGYAYAQYGYGYEYYPPNDQYGNSLCGYDNQGYPVYCNSDRDYYGDGYNYYGYGPNWRGDEERHEFRGNEREWGEHHERGEHHEGGEHRGEHH